MKSAIKYLLRPLVDFLEISENGDDIYQYLYFTRSGVEDEVEAAIMKGNHNITIVGKPGMGKTSLMHYMFIRLKKKNNLYPIILDYRKIAPRKAEAVLTTFVKEARNYFYAIGYPLNQIDKETTLANCEDHSLQVQAHLASIPKSSLNKKMVIFLDDLDYADEEYMKILNDYFLPYVQTDKANLVLSVRQPLLNTIKRYDPLRLNYHSYPREIAIPEDDFEFIITNRLKTILRKDEEEEGNLLLLSKKEILSKFRKLFRMQTLDDILLEKIREISPEFTSENLELPFEGNFFSKLKNITYSNLRMVEELLPDMIDWETKNPQDSLNDNFYDNFIRLTIKKQNILLDLVTDKTRSANGKHNDNSVLQNVLEYFKFEEVANDFFYAEMIKLGINKELADRAIEQLVNTPYSLIVPDYINQTGTKEVSSILKRYKINIKGTQYVENILRNPLYYSLENELGSTFTKSKFSYYDERNRKENRPVR